MLPVHLAENIRKKVLFYLQSTFDFREKGRYVFKMDVSPDGANWHPFMEGSYQKS